MKPHEIKLKKKKQTNCQIHFDRLASVSTGNISFYFLQSVKRAHFPLVFATVTSGNQFVMDYLNVCQALRKDNTRALIG